MTAAAGRDGLRSELRGGPVAARTMSIGAVLELLRPEFPDVSISKIRFLEDQGLVEPARTPSGYRKFGPADVDRLRYVLGVQRDHYLPLRVIRDHLSALDRGLEPPVDRPLGPAPRLVGADDDDETPLDRRLTRQQVLAAAGADDGLLTELESYGLVSARPGGTYDADAGLIVRTAAELAAFGIEPRHLRAFRSAADREAGLVEQVVSPLRRQRGSEAERADEVAREVSGLCGRLHAVLLRAALDRGGS